MMNWREFTPGDKVIFFGDINWMIDKHGNKMYCPLVYGKKYRVINVCFWGDRSFLRVEGNDTFWEENLFCSKKEWKQINKSVSELVK